MRQSKPLLKLTNADKKNKKKQCFRLPFVAIRATQDNRKLFLTILDLPSSIVLKFSIAAYPVWLLPLYSGHPSKHVKSEHYRKMIYIRL